MKLKNERNKIIFKWKKAFFEIDRKLRHLSRFISDKYYEIIDLIKEKNK